MAKLNAPLFSFRASGKIAKALVYFGWKGLNVVRSYVIPANPKSKLQRDQRGYLREAVTAIHDAQALTDQPLCAADQTALALLGSTRPTPRTWFNEAVKNWVDRRVNGKFAALFRNGYSYDIEAETAGVSIYFSTATDEGALGTANFYYGTSKTALVNVSRDVEITGEDHYTVPDISVTESTKYFWQLRVQADNGGEGNRSGIYKFETPAAA